MELTYLIASTCIFTAFAAAWNKNDPLNMGVKAILVIYAGFGAMITYHAMFP